MGKQSEPFQSDAILFGALRFCPAPISKALIARPFANRGSETTKKPQIYRFISLLRPFGATLHTHPHPPRTRSHIPRGRAEQHISTSFTTSTPRIMSGIQPGTVMSRRAQFTNPEVLEQFIAAGRKKSQYGHAKLFFLSLLGGFFLGMGALMSSQVGGRWGGTTGQNNFTFGGFGIPFGLIMIVFTGAELVTGNFLVFAILLIHEPTWKTFYESWRSFLVSWWGNFCGTMLVASCIAWQSGVVATAYSEFDERPSVFATIADMKAALGPGGTWCSDGNFKNANACFLIKSTVMRAKMGWDIAVLRGIACNFLVCTALWLAQLSQEQVSKIFSIWICIVMFISSGFEHIVVNQLLCPTGLMIGAVEFGDITVGDVFRENLIPVTFGNFIGASILAMIMYGCYHRDLPEWIAAQKAKHTTETPEVSISLPEEKK